MEVGRLEHEAGVGSCLEIWQEGEDEVHLREVVDLEVGVNAVVRFPVFSHPETGVADQLEVDISMYLELTLPSSGHIPHQSSFPPEPAALQPDRSA